MTYIILIMEKRVSIIIPCCNQAEFVSEAIESALNQTYKNIEIVVVNDGSSDNSSDVINAYKNKNIIFIDNKENKGVVHTRNLAIEKASGEYILPLDADDKIAPEYAEKAVKILEENKEIGIVYCEAEYFGTKSGKWNLPDYEDTSFLYNNCIFCSSMFRKTDFVAAGGYKENMKYGWEDWDLWLSFIEKGLKPYKIPEILFFYRQHDGNGITKKVAQNYGVAQLQIIGNHADLYLNNSFFVEKAFGAAESLNIIKQLQKKKKKYNKLTKILMGVNVLQFVLCLLFFIFWLKV